MSASPPTTITETIVIPAPLDVVWNLLADTGRYAEWVESCEQVTYHHGRAEPGGVYREVGHGLGPLTVTTTWTVAELREDGPARYRRDTGAGMPLVSGLESIFELQPDATPDSAAPAGGVRFTWHNRYRPGLGALGRRIDALQHDELRGMMRRSMATLSQLASATGAGDGA